MSRPAFRRVGFAYYTYNSDGIRTQKTVIDPLTSDNYTVKYVLDGSKILRETRINNTTGAVVYTMDFMYDDSGVAGFIYNGTSYYYIKNLQGDVRYICNASGNIVVAYTYDAWGNILSTTGSMVGTIGKYNPFRYRGYYYDSEIALYYLNSRFYDPQVGRFINADGIVGANGGILGYNMFAYCNNNPVMGYDPTGEYDANSRLLSRVGVKDAIGISLIIGVGGAIILSSSDILVEPIEGLIDDIRTTLKKAKEKIKAKVEEKVDVLPIPPKSDSDIIFPENPLEFAPFGLVMTVYPGTKNGTIIKWQDPITKIAVFEWDEDLLNGSHYHICVFGIHTPEHYKAGEEVPAPWSTIYFGGF